MRSMNIHSYTISGEDICGAERHGGGLGNQQKTINS